MHNPEQYESSKEKLLSIITQEYMRSLSKKQRKQKIEEIINKNVVFADLTVWFFNRNCQQSLDEAKQVWEKLPPNQLQKHTLIEFFRVYVDEIFDKLQKYVHYQGQYKKIEIILNRTVGLIQSLDEIFQEVNIDISALKQQNQSTLKESIEHSNVNDMGQSLNFKIFVGRIEGHDLSEEVQNEELEGYHLEISYKENTSQTKCVLTDGNALNFNEPMNFNLKLESGSIFLALYQDFRDTDNENKAKSDKHLSIQKDLSAIQNKSKSSNSKSSDKQIPSKVFVENLTSQAINNKIAQADAQVANKKVQNTEEEKKDGGEEQNDSQNQLNRRKQSSDEKDASNQLDNQNKNSNTQPLKLQNIQKGENDNDSDNDDDDETANNHQILELKISEKSEDEDNNNNNNNDDDFEYELDNNDPQKSQNSGSSDSVNRQHSNNPPSKPDTSSIEQLSVKKKLIAQRNLDLFTNVNQQFLNDMLAFNREHVQNDDIKYDNYHLKVVKPPKNAYKLDMEQINGNNDYIKVSLSIHVDAYSSCEDLLQFYKLMLKRKSFLESKIESIRLKYVGYNQKIQKLILPFRNVIALNQNSLQFISQKPKKGGCGPPCNLF